MYQLISNSSHPQLQHGSTWSRVIISSVIINCSWLLLLTQRKFDAMTFVPTNNFRVQINAYVPSVSVCPSVCLCRSRCTPRGRLPSTSHVRDPCSIHARICGRCVVLVAMVMCCCGDGVAMVMVLLWWWYCCCWLTVPPTSIQFHPIITTVYNLPCPCLCADVVGGGGYPRRHADAGDWGGQGSLLSLLAWGTGHTGVRQILHHKLVRAERPNLRHPTAAYQEKDCEGLCYSVLRVDINQCQLLIAVVFK